MAIGLVTNESTLGVAVESTEGTYVAPSSGTDYLEILADSTELNKSREELTRNTLSGSVESEASRVGIAEVSGSIGVELKASATEGDAPQCLDVLMRSLLGGKRQITSDQTSGTTHTSTVINFADTSAFSVGDILLVKQPGAYECRPIASIQTNTSITLAFALDNGAPGDGVVVAQVTTYYSDTTNAVTFSAEHNLGTSGIKQKARGLRAVSGSVENLSVGQLPSMSFGVQGLDIDREDANAAATADFTGDALPPVTLSACIWVNGTSYSYTEASLSIENTVNYIADACDADGRIGSRITEQVTTFSFNPYTDSSDLTNWNAFNNNDDVSVFFYAYNPTATAGEFSEAVAFWLPQGKITASPVADTDGIVSDAVEIKAHKSSGNDSIFMSFI